MSLLDDLSEVLSRHSAENGSDTPDYLLAGYLAGCLKNFDCITQQREMWHGRSRTDPNVSPKEGT
jgi:hypothetical protein